jgi:WD40 repeat protein
MSVHAHFKSLLLSVFVLHVLFCSPSARGLAVVADEEFDVVDVCDETPQLVVDADGFTAVKINHLAISSNGDYLAAAAGKIVRVWDLKNNRPWAVLRGYQERQGYHIGFIDSISFSPNGQFLTVGVSDNTEFGSTREYDLSKPHELHRLIPGQGGCTRKTEYSPDDKYLLTYG